MKTRTIIVSIQQERELYEALVSTAMNHTEYDGCYVMQLSEHRDRDGLMVAEFTMCESTEESNC